MIEQWLVNANENAIVTKTKIYPQMNKARDMMVSLS
jgi:hypothetical protein